MAEHIVAVFDSEGAADAAGRDLEHAGISSSAIRRYRLTAMGAGNATTRPVSPATSRDGGFWSWLLGEEPGPEATHSLSRNEQVYERHAEAGKTVLSVLVEDDARIHQAVALITAHHPIEMEEQTEEPDAETSADGGTPGSSAPSAAGAVEAKSAS